MQTLTVASRSPAAVVYQSTYSDGKTAQQRPAYGGTNSGLTDEGGEWTDTWAVGPTAPAGDVLVYVHVATTDDDHNFSLPFVVGPTTDGGCAT